MNGSSDNSARVPKHVTATAPSGIEQLGEGTTVIHSKLLPETELQKGIFRKCMIEAERLKLFHLALREYVRLEEKSHPEELFGYVTEGAISLSVNRAEHTLYEGDSYFLPRHVPYSITALYPSKIVELVINLPEPNLPNRETFRISRLSGSQ